MTKITDLFTAEQISGMTWRALEIATATAADINAHCEADSSVSRSRLEMEAMLEWMESDDYYNDFCDEQFAADTECVMQAEAAACRAEDYKVLADESDMPAWGRSFDKVDYILNELNCVNYDGKHPDDLQGLIDSNPSLARLAAQYCDRMANKSAEIGLIGNEAAQLARGHQLRSMAARSAGNRMIADMAAP